LFAALENLDDAVDIYRA